MAYPVTLNGRTYTLADFEGTNYVEGLPDAFEDFVTHAGDIYNSTSTTSNSIGTGSKTFTVESAKPYQAGTPLRIADAAAPSTNFMDCIVTSYSGTTLVVDAVGYAGSGTFTSWNVNIGGAASVAGTVAIAQGGTGATTAAAARTNLDVYSKADADSRFLNVSGEASDVTMTGNVTIGDAAGDTLSVPATASFSGGISGDVAFDTDTMFVDASVDRVGFGTTTPTNSINVEWASAGHGTGIDLTNTQAGGYGGSLSWYSTRSDDSSSVQAAQIRTFGEENWSSAATASSVMQFRVVKDSNFYEQFRLSGTEVVVNEDSRDTDFRVESDSNSGALFVDASTSFTGINTSTPTTNLDVNGSVFLGSASFGSGSTVTINNSVGGTGDSLTIKNSAASISGRGTRIAFASNIQAVAKIESKNQTDNTGGSLELYSSFGGTFYRNMFNGYAESIINPDSHNMDFRVESDGKSHMLFVDAGNNVVSINNSENQSEFALNVVGTATSGGRVAKLSGPDVNTSTATSAPQFVIENSNSTTNNISGLAFASSGGGTTAFIGAQNTNHTTHSGDLYIATRGPANGYLNKVAIRDSDMIINDSGVNYDFRVESDTYSHMLFVDAGSNFISVGSVNPSLASGFNVTPTATYGNTVSHRAADGIPGSGQRANMISGILTIPTTSSGNQLTIPVTYSGSFWAQYYVRLVVVSAEYNMSAGKAGEATFTFGAATSISNLITLSTTGNISSIAGVNASSPNPHTLQINFTSAYTSGLNNWEGIQLYYEIVSSWPDRMEMQNAALN